MNHRILSTDGPNTPADEAYTEEMLSAMERIGSVALRSAFLKVLKHQRDFGRIHGVYRHPDSICTVLGTQLADTLRGMVDPDWWNSEE